MKLMIILSNGLYNKYGLKMWGDTHDNTIFLLIFFKFVWIMLTKGMQLSNMSLLISIIVFKFLTLEDTILMNKL
jgi:ABC-type uncharacterized transport system permease subunit